MQTGGVTLPSEQAASGKEAATIYLPLNTNAAGIRSASLCLLNFQRLGCGAPRLCFVVVVTELWLFIVLNIQFLSPEETRTRENFK